MLVARQSIGRERVAVISRTLLRGGPGEDRDIAAAIAVEVFHAPFPGNNPVLKNLDFGRNRHSGAVHGGGKRRSAMPIN